MLGAACCRPGAAGNGLGGARRPDLVRRVRVTASWIDFADGSVSFWRERFARPGVVVATGGPILAHEARAAGAATFTGTCTCANGWAPPAQPADVALMEKRADSLFDYAVSVTGCQQPLIALNELWGSWLPMPLTPTAERYRENVLRFVRRLSERGARPALPRLRRPVHGRRGGCLVEVDRPGLGHRPREVRERECHRRGGVVRGSRRRASAIGAGRPSFSRSGCRPRASG